MSNEISDIKDPEVRLVLIDQAIMICKVTGNFEDIVDLQWQRVGAVSQIREQWLSNPENVIELQRVFDEQDNNE